MWVGSIVGAAVNNLKPTATGATLSIFQTLPYRRYSTSYGILLERNKTPVTVVRGLYLSEDAAHTSPVQGCPCPEVIIESPHQIARHLPRHPYTTYPRAAADVTPAEFGHLRSRPGAALSSTEFGHLRSRPGALWQRFRPRLF